MQSIGFKVGGPGRQRRRHGSAERGHAVARLGSGSPRRRGRSHVPAGLAAPRNRAPEPRLARFRSGTARRRALILLRRGHWEELNLRAKEVVSPKIVLYLLTEPAVGRSCTSGGHLEA